MFCHKKKELKCNLILSLPSPSSNLMTQRLGVEMNKADWVLEGTGKAGMRVTKKTHAGPQVTGAVLLQGVVIIRNFRRNIVTSLEFNENSKFTFHLKSPDLKNMLAICFQTLCGPNKTSLQAGCDPGISRM